ncbi:unnamed protein product [Urochloa humidicola]
MAEPTLLDPSPFDLRHYPAHLFDPDLPLAGGDLPLEFVGDDDLEFDLPVDFSIDNFLLRSPDRGGDGDDSGERSAAKSGPTAFTSASPNTSAANSADDPEVKHKDSDEGRSGTAPNWSLKRKQASPGTSSDGAPIRRRRAFPVRVSVGFGVAGRRGGLRRERREQRGRGQAPDCAFDADAREQSESELRAARLRAVQKLRMAMRISQLRAGAPDGGGEHLALSGGVDATSTGSRSVAAHAGGKLLQRPSRGLPGGPWEMGLDGESRCLPRVRIRVGTLLE